MRAAAAVAALSLFCSLSPLAVAEEADCPIKFYRWEEDCRNLAGRELTGIDALRLVPLGPGATLTFGGEARFAFEELTDPNFGLRHPPASDAFARLGYLHADLRTEAGPRFFLQM